MQYTLSQIDSIADTFVKEVLPHSQKVLLFQGAMGAGKTTFIKALCRSLGVGDRVSSPTFSLVNEYQAHEGKVFHFDLYRIEEEQEALDFGIEEYWDSGSWCFVEWAERIPSLLPLHYTEVQLTVIDETTRSLTVVQHN